MPILFVLLDVKGLLVLLVRHELDPGVGNDPRHGGRVAAPQAEQAGVGVGHAEKLEGAEDAVAPVRVRLEVDLGAVERRDRRLGERAGQGSGGHVCEDHLQDIGIWSNAMERGGAMLDLCISPCDPPRR